MRLGHYYRIAAIYPSIAAIILVSVFSIVSNRNYQSEWLTPAGAIFLDIVYAFLFIVILCLLSLTIFLSRYEFIERNKTLNFLSWFLLPLGFISMILVYEAKQILEIKIDTSSFFYPILSLPYIIGLIWAFCAFKKERNIHLNGSKQILQMEKDGNNHDRYGRKSR
ncbi:MAG: hypothetical protein HWE07_00020 [Cytophagia bacterium]|nr:hypothetical protein [Cytophagia bacterium]